MKRLLSIFFSFFLFIFSFFIFFPSPAWAVCYKSVEVPEGSDNWVQVATVGCLELYIQKAINFIFPLAAAVALLFLILGGIKFITSGGDPKSAEGAKKTMTYALAGLAVIFLVWFIFWVIKQMTGVDLRQFDIVR